MAQDTGTTVKIGMLVWTFRPGPEGGAERQCGLLVQTLAGAGVECCVLTSRSRYSLPRSSMDGAAAVHRFGSLCPWAERLRGRIPGVAGFWISLPVVWLARLVFLVELLLGLRSNRLGLDVLHVHESGWLAGVGVALARRWGIPVVVKEATAPALKPIGYDTPLRGLWDRRRREADAWIAPTAAAEADLRAAGVPGDRIHVLPNGVLIPADAADPARSEEVLYVGNLTQGAEWKAFDILFVAWIEVVRARAGARMTVVGGGDPEPWRRVLRQAGVEGTVRFAGRSDDPTPFYRAAGIFVLPSRVEGLSNALLEAQGFGLACIVSDIPGNRAVVQDGVNGRIVPVGDARALADAVADLLGDPAARARLGAGARGVAAGPFAMEAVASRVRAVYEALTVRKEPAACA